MSPAIGTTALAAIICTCSLFVGPALDDMDAAQAVHEELQRAPESLQRRARIEAAAQAMCAAEGGENAVATWLPDGSVQCLTKRNYKTVRYSAATVASAQGGTP